MVSPGTDSSYFQNFTANFNNEEMMRANPELTPYEHRLRNISNEGITSPLEVQSPSVLVSPSTGEQTVTK